VKSKFDENLPSDLGALLCADGHDAHSVLDEDLRGAADPAIAKVCQDEQRILITLDLDFAHIKNYPPQDYPGLSCDWRVRTATRCSPSFLASSHCSRRNPFHSVSGLWMATEHESEAGHEPSPNNKGCSAAEASTTPLVEQARRIRRRGLMLLMFVGRPRAGLTAPIRTRDSQFGSLCLAPFRSG